MKTLLILLLFPLFVISQDTIIIHSIPKIDTTINQVCIERGHVRPDVVSKTLLYCPPYIEDYIDSTVMIYPACNWIQYYCKRCGEYITEKEKERRVVIWRKKK